MLTWLLYLSFFVIIALGIYLLKIEKKQSIHWAFLANIICVSLWTLGLVLDNIMITYYSKNIILFTYITYLGLTFYPVTLWITSLAFKNPNFKWHNEYLLTGIIPFISDIVLWTNNYHHLFYITFRSLGTNENIYGPYFYFAHAPYFYLFNLLWALNITIYAIRNGGILAKQVTLAVTGTAVFLGINMAFTFGVKWVSSAYASIFAFAFMMICYLVAMVKYNFLNIIPIAKDKIIDSLVDGFIVLDNNFKIQNINKSFIKTFNDVFPIQVGDNFLDCLVKNKVFKITPEQFNDIIEKNVSGVPSLPIEILISKNNADKWFNVEISCVSKSKDIGSIVVFKNITYQKQNQIISMERTKLRGFAQIAGDLAHDINSPLSNARNLAEDLINLFDEYKDIPEKIGEQYEWVYNKLQRLYNTCEKSLKIANKLKNQVVYIYNEERTSFKVKNVILDIMKDIDIKMLLNQLDCTYNIDGDTEVVLLGYPENLYRVLKNLIKNAIESYTDKQTDHKIVEITIIQEKHDDEDSIIIAVKDYGIGIKKELQNDIFNKPLKTKNLKATGGGVSLFFAPLIVTGQLQGNIRFESEEGVGSTFYISIPVTCGLRAKEKLH